MLVNFDKEYRVIWYNEEISKEDATIYLSENTIWLDTSMPKAESKDGYYPVYYLNDDMQSIRVEYEQIPEPQPTQLDSIEQTQLLITEAMADQYEQRLETDLMMMDAQATTFEAVLALTEGMV